MNIESNQHNNSKHYTSNPWVGLSSYEDPEIVIREGLKPKLFCGRKKESNSVAQLIVGNIFVTLYGKSGTGKTSLLKAGVYPILRKKRYLPITVRLSIDAMGISFQQCIINKISQAVIDKQGHIETYNVVDFPEDDQQLNYLWTYFARTRFVSNDNKVLFPVIVLDQFEEILREHYKKAEILLRQIAYMMDESHMLRNRVVDGQQYVYDFNFRFVASIREDDLYRLEDCIDNCYIAALKRCRYRLRSLSVKDARSVIQIPGRDCIEETEMEEITNALIQEIEEDDQVSSLMLSLTCNQLYNELKEGAKITLSKVGKQEIKSSIKRFYTDAVYKLADKREEFEKKLVENGHRKPITLKEYKELIPGGLYLLDDERFRILTKIKISSVNDDAHTFVELAHDKLAQVIEEMRKEPLVDNRSSEFKFNYKQESSSTSGKKDVFISYKRESAPFVTRLYKELESHDIKAWVDLNELHQYIGEEYTHRIHNGIENSEFYLLIYSKDIEESDFIINEELRYAINKHKTILFYPKEKIDINKSKLKEFVGKIQWLDTEAIAIHQTDTQETIVDEKRLTYLSSIVNKKIDSSVFDDQSLFLIRMALQRLLGKITVFGNYKKLCGTGVDEFYDNNQFEIHIINKAFFISAPEKYRKPLEDLHFFRTGKSLETVKHLERLKPNVSDLSEQLKNFLNENKAIYSLPVLYNSLSAYLKANKYKGISLPTIETFNIQHLINTVSEMVACTFISDLKLGRVMFNGMELGVYDITDGRTTNSEEHCIDMQLYYTDYFTFKCMTEMYHILCSIDGRPFEINSTRDVRSLSPFLCSLGLGGFLAAYINGMPSLMWTKRSGNISSGDIWHFSYDETVSLLFDGAKDIHGHLIIDENARVAIDTNSILYRALKEEIGISPAKINEGRHGIFEIGIIQSERLEIELISQAVVYLQDSSSPEEQIKEMYGNANDGYLEIAKMKFIPLRNRNELIGKLLTPESFAVFTRMQNRLNDNVGRTVRIGPNTLIETGSFVDDGASIGDNCRIHRNVYIGKNVTIGNNVKIQNYNSIYEGVTLEDGVFVGTNVSFINDRYPRSIMRDGRQVVSNDWILEETHVCYGASIGAGSVIMCGVTIGKWAMVAAGSVVLEDVPEGCMVAGNPAKVIKTNIKY